MWKIEDLYDKVGGIWEDPILSTYQPMEQLRETADDLGKEVQRLQFSGRTITL
jgi:hypothetical protein